MSEQYEQGSPEWLAARAGKITASRFADAIAMSGREANKPTEARNAYMYEIVAEIRSGKPTPEVFSASLKWGKENEEHALAAYELRSGNFVTRSGLIVHPVFPFIAASPDGLIGDVSGVEIKCPKQPLIHIKTVLHGMPDDHIAQVQGAMFVTGRRSWDFVSFDPRNERRERLYIQTVERDDGYINDVLKPGLLRFWVDVQATIKQLEKVAP